jgi:diketogulonate reductase-like aldo/keto reductase
MSRNITFTLSNGVKIPGLGFGTFASEGSPGETYRAVLHALRTGYRHLDCAWFYRNEDEVGNGIADFLRESNGKVSREDIFVTTKVWNHLHGTEGVKWSLTDSLKRLKLEYVDLFLIHWPIAVEADKETMLPKIGSDGKVCYVMFILL